MSNRKRGRHWYGRSLADVREELLRFSGLNGYVTTQFAESTCKCGGRTFHLATDEDAGVAVRICVGCGANHTMGDGADYVAEANPAGHECACGSDTFELMSAVALYDNSSDVRWFYVGCYCPSCNLVGCFADWKSESGDWRSLLSNV